MEGCLKFARRYWFTQGVTTRTGFVALENAFGGRTMGALSVTWDEHYRAPFQPLIGPVTFVPAGDVTALKAAVTGKTAAVIAEPIQGEGGIRPLSREFAQAINDVCRSTGALYIADEVQTGLGRTGYPFYFPRLAFSRTWSASARRLGAASRSARC